MSKSGKTKDPLARHEGRNDSATHAWYRVKKGLKGTHAGTGRSLIPGQLHYMELTDGDAATEVFERVTPAREKAETLDPDRETEKPVDPARKTKPTGVKNG